MKGRNGQVARIYRILTLLEGAPHGLTVAEILDRLQDRDVAVGRRTVYRDLDALRLAGFPLEERGNGGDPATRWTLQRTTRVNHYLVLSSRELLALYLARAVLTPLRETPFYEDLNSTFGKIEDKIGKQAKSFLHELSEDLYFEPGPRWGLGLDPDVVDTVRAGCTERQVLTIRYASVNSGTTRERQVGPHYLYFAKGSLYLVAEDLEDHKIKVFAVPRMEQAEMTEAAYDGAVIEPEEFFNHSFGIFRGDSPQKVVVRFHPHVAGFVRERRWHPSQQVIALEKGWIEVRLDVAITPELTQWILGFGSRVRVVEPAALVREIQDEAQRTISLYDVDKKAG